MRALSFPKTKKGKALVVAGVITVATAGGAYAYWSSLGTGTGAASTGTSSAFVVTTDAATGGPLHPGRLRPRRSRSTSRTPTAASSGSPPSR